MAQYVLSSDGGTYCSRTHDFRRNKQTLPLNLTHSPPLNSAALRGQHYGGYERSPLNLSIKLQLALSRSLINQSFDKICWLN